ncbi:MAG: dihydropteroate synthase [Actinomycetales bacterium]
MGLTPGRITPAELTRGVGGRCLVMGVVNVTPDSFSDGGAWFDPDVAIEHGLELVAQGADLLDVGGESTRPGAARVSPQEEIRRVLPVIEGLVAGGVRVSVDTMRAATAVAAVQAGAVMVNDVSGGLADPALPRVAADADVTYVAMHWRGHSATMDSLARYDGPGGAPAAVLAELSSRVDELVRTGLSPELLVLDPGIGFAKTAAHNWAVLAHLDLLITLGLPLLVGTSRKRFLGQLGDPDAAPVAPGERDHATAATTALAAQAGAWGVRVHEVPANVAAVAVAQAWRAGR